MAASREARRCGGGGNGERAGRGAAAGAGGDALQSHPRAERTRVGARGGTSAQRLGAQRVHVRASQGAAFRGVERGEGCAFGAPLFHPAEL